MVEIMALTILSNGDRNRVGLDCSDSPSLTKQEFRDECNINNIMKKYRTRGDLTHISSTIGEYGTFDQGEDLLHSRLILQNAEAAFIQLPSGLRRELDHEPANFVDWIKDPENEQRAFDMGLLESIEEKAEGPPPTPPAGTEAEIPVESPEAD